MAIQTDVDMEALDGILSATPDIDSGDLIYILQEIQTAYGYLPRPILSEMSNRTSIPISRIYGVATFYEQFHLAPHGKHTVRCCRGTACHVRGAQSVSDAIARTLKIEPDQTTPDMLFTFETVACLGTCFLAPVMMVDDDYYGHLTADKIQDILERYT
ncbi:MAG: NADH-quinone oxidoreductase subunit NuoE [Planctomycetes bacterium]|nr:NADH-quinone oxidoreductase subunit NuoE [Planctomycetota bacterium]